MRIFITIIITALVSSAVTYQIVTNSLTSLEQKQYLSMIELVKACQVELEKSINGE